MRESFVETRSPEDIQAVRAKIAHQIGESHATDSHLAQNPKLDLVAVHPEDFVFHQEGHPIAAEAIKPIAEIADPRFDDMLAETANQMSIVRAIGRSLLEGDNVNILTSHGELIDPGLELANESHYLGKLSLDDQPAVNVFDEGVKRGIIVTHATNRMGVRLGSNENPPLPIADALKMLCDDIWKSYPPTPSMLGLRDDPEIKAEIKANNDGMLESIEACQDEGKLLLAMAPSGRQDKPENDGDPTIVMHRVNSGTVELLTNGKAVTVFVAIWLKDGKVMVKYLGEPEMITKASKIHKGMAKMAAVLSEKTDHEFKYEKPTLRQRLKTSWRELRSRRLSGAND